MGLGINKDPQAAAQFYNRACKMGEKRFCKLLQRFEDREENE